jgi:peroxisomal coenzyme A diphosphatase NUDT7
MDVETQLPAIRSFTQRCLQTLAAYKPPRPPTDPDLLYPLSRSAAVLVALFVGRTGDLYVMLSRLVPKLPAKPNDRSS